MTYTKTVWVNGTAPAINATNLNKIENQLEKTIDTDGSQIISNGITITGTTTVSQIISTGSITASILISDVAQGTSPIRVTSTTSVTNLNADYLDGYHFSGISAPNVIHLFDQLNSIGTTYASSQPIFFKWNDNFATNRSIYFESHLFTEYTPYTAYARLYNVTDSTQVVEISSTGTGFSTSNVIRSSAITLTNDKFYIVQVKTSNASSNARADMMRLIIL